MSDYMALNAVQGLSDQLVAVRVSFEVAEFLKLVQAEGTTSANIQAWLTANPGEVQNIFGNEVVAKTMLSRPAWASLIYGSAIGLASAMNSAAWVTALVANPANVDTILSTPGGLSAIANSATALDVIYFNSTGIGGGAYARFLALSDTIVYARPTTLTAGQTAAIPPLAGRFILMSASISANWPVSNTVRWSGQTVGNAPSDTVHSSAAPLITFATYNDTTITVVAGSISSAGVMTFRVFPAP